MNNQRIHQTLSEKTLNRVTYPNVVIIGSTASGKTTVGEQVARLLGFGFLDLDKWIVNKSGKAIADIFQEHGETGFREVERTAINELGNLKNHVLVAGGGAIEDEENWEALRRLGRIVWLATPVSAIVKRIFMSPDQLRARPLLAEAANIGDNDARREFITGKIEGMLERRASRFESADFILQDGFSTPETSAHLIVRMLLDSQDEGKA